MIMECREQIQKFTENEDYVKADAAYKELAKLERSKKDTEHQEKLTEEKEKLMKVHEEQQQRRKDFIEHWKQEEIDFTERCQIELEQFEVWLSAFLIVLISNFRRDKKKNL